MVAGGDGKLSLWGLPQNLSKPKKWFIRVRTHDQNFVPLIICNIIVTLLKINVPSRQINIPPCQINVPPCQINVPHFQINLPLSKKFPKFLRQNHDPRDIYFPEGHILVSLFDHVYGPLGATFNKETRKKITGLIQILVYLYGCSSAVVVPGFQSRLFLKEIFILFIF